MKAKEVRDGDEYDAIEDNNNAPLVLQQFACNSTQNGLDIVSQGFVFSSKYLLEQFYSRLTLMPKGIALLLDGTFKLIVNGWVLLVLGMEVIVRGSSGKDNFGGNESFVHSCRPIVFAVFRAENCVSVVEMLKALEIFHDNWKLSLLPLKDRILSVTIDHSEPLRKGCLEFLGVDKIIDCYAHMIRNLKKEKSRLKHAQSQSMDIIVAQIQEAHLSRSYEMFKIVTQCIIADLKASEEIEFADWFHTSYLTPPWDTWWIGASGIAGVSASNNAIESFNRCIKRPTVIAKSMSMSLFLTKGIANICDMSKERYDSQRGRCYRDVGNQFEYLQNWPMPQEIRLAAKFFYLHFLFKAHDEVGIDSSSRRWYFNSHRVGDLEITRTRVHNFFNVKYNKFGESQERQPDEGIYNWFARIGSIDATAGVPINAPPTNFSDAKSMLLTLHEVTETVTETSTSLNCDCKAFHNTAYLCSHVLTIANVIGKVNSDFGALAKVTRKTGRPASRPLALEYDNAHLLNPTTAVYMEPYGLGIILRSINTRQHKPSLLVVFPRRNATDKCLMCNCTDKIHLIYDNVTVLRAAVYAIEWARMDSADESVSSTQSSPARSSSSSDFADDFTDETQFEGLPIPQEDGEESDED